MTQDNPTPTELQPIECALDRLARAERDATPTGFASRLAQAGAAAEPPGVIARIGFDRALRVAAALAIGAIGVTAGVLMMNPGQSADPVDAQALIDEGVSTMQLVYASTNTHDTEDPFWSLGLSDRSNEFDGERSLWDLGDDALSAPVQWPDAEEVL